MSQPSPPSDTPADAKGAHRRQRTHTEEGGAASSDRERSSPRTDTERERICRVCFEKDNQESLIAPCLCRGGQQWIHRTCLNEWRSQDRFPLAFSRCPTCLFEYQTEVKSAKPTLPQKCVYCGLVVRDLVIVVIGVLSTVAFLSTTVSTMDPRPSRPILHLFPYTWAEEHLDPFAWGPYMASGLTLFLACLGVVGIFVAMSTSMGEFGRAQFCTSCYLLDCIPWELEAIPCLLVSVVILACIGLFVGIGFAFMTIQYIAKRHVKVLWLRGEAERVAVIDISRNSGHLA